MFNITFVNPPIFCLLVLDFEQQILLSIICVASTPSTLLFCGSSLIKMHRSAWSLPSLPRDLVRSCYPTPLPWERPSHGTASDIDIELSTRCSSQPACDRSCRPSANSTYRVLDLWLQPYRSPLSILRFRFSWDHFKVENGECICLTVSLSHWENELENLQVASKPLRFRDGTHLATDESYETDGSFLWQSSYEVSPGKSSDLFNRPSCTVDQCFERAINKTNPLGAKFRWF